MGFTLIGPWNCPCKAVVLPLIGITWDLHWSIHETAHINHCLATHWCYMGFTLVGPWNFTWKPTAFPHIGIAWVLHLWTHLLWLAHETAHKNPLFFHTLALHGVYDSWNCPYKLLSCHAHIGVTWDLLRLVIETTHEKPLFYNTLVWHKSTYRMPNFLGWAFLLVA